MPKHSAYARKDKDNYFVEHADGRSQAFGTFHGALNYWGENKEGSTQIIRTPSSGTGRVRTLWTSNFGWKGLELTERQHDTLERYMEKSGLATDEP